MKEKVIFSIVLCIGGFFLTSCSSYGIHLESKKYLPILSPNECKMQTEIRTYRVLFLLPFYSHKIVSNASNIKEADRFIYESNSFAKPWDIVFTTLGFLLSFNSSTEVNQECPKEIFLNQFRSYPSSTFSNPQFAYWRAEGNSRPIDSIEFSPDDYKLNEILKTKIIALSRYLLKSEETFRVVLVGKSSTSGDLAYQVRLVHRRLEEIRNVLLKESVEKDRIISFVSDKSNENPNIGDNSIANSSVQIYFIK